MSKVTSKDNYKPLCMAVLFIVVGLIAPSNSVDDKTGKTPFELLLRLFLAILGCAIFYLLWKTFDKKDSSYKSDIKTRQKDLF